MRILRRVGGLFISVSRRCALIAGLFLALILCASLALANPPPKPKNPGPLDIPDSQVLKMTIDQYIDAYTKKHNGDINEPETRALCYYYAALRRDENFRLARRLSPARRRLVRRCQAVFDSLSQACYDYQYSVVDGTIVYDFYSSLEVDSEEAMHTLVRDLRSRNYSDRNARRQANSEYLKAWKSLRHSYHLIAESDQDSFFPKKERIANYQKAKSALRATGAVLNALPDSAKRDFAHQVYEITDTVNEE